MKLAARQNNLLYDGECGVCARMMEIARNIDKRQQFALQPYQAVEEAELARYGLSADACDRKLQVITARERVYAGAFGVNFFLWQYWPWKIFVLLVYVLPPLLLLEILAYALVARYRRQISQWLGLTACALPARPARERGERIS